MSQVVEEAMLGGGSTGQLSVISGAQLKQGRTPWRRQTSKPCAPTISQQITPDLL